ncbi:S1/P1 nuclease, partial [Blyttiomyces helicus]
AYGRIGHWLTGYIAQQLLTPEAQLFVEELLPEQKGLLRDVANWADDIKSNHSYDWAKPMHYVNPANECTPPVPSDCTGVCVLTGITNYTASLSNPLADRPIALKFLIHLIGDLHNPLHVSGRARGGTQAPCMWRRRRVNLHQVWDHLMFEKRIADGFGGRRERYGDWVVEQLESKWAASVPGWIACPGGNGVASSCPLVWAAESSQANCDVVWPGYERRGDMSEAYYKKGIESAERLLVQAALRTATVI